MLETFELWILCFNIGKFGRLAQIGLRRSSPLYQFILFATALDSTNPWCTHMGHITSKVTSVSAFFRKGKTNSNNVDVSQDLNWSQWLNPIISSATHVANNSVTRRRNKHIDKRVRFLRDRVNKNIIKVKRKRKPSSHLALSSTYKTATVPF